MMADSSVSGLANAIGPMVGASVAAGAGLQSPFVFAAGMMAVGALVAILKIEDRQPMRRY